MRRSLIAVTAAAALLASAPAAPVPKEKPQHVYFPTTVGAKWTYRLLDGEAVEVVTKVEAKGRGKVISVGRVWDSERVTPLRVVEVTDEGLFELRHRRPPLRPGGPGQVPEDAWEVHESPLCLLKLPSKPGDTWANERARGDKVSYTVGTPERVKVPAGEFMAIPVDTVFTTPDRHTCRTRYWYATGVGAVKWAQSAAIEVVLTSFTPGKD